MKITNIKIEKYPVEFQVPLTISFGSIKDAINWFVKIETDDGIYGLGASSPFAPVTGETAETSYEVLKMFKESLIGLDCEDIAGVHKFMDNIIYGNGSSKCAIDIALYDIMGKKLGLPVYKALGGKNGIIKNDVTIGISSPREMAELARHYVHDMGFGILKVKIGSDFNKDLEALNMIREVSGHDVIIRVDANQGYDVDTTLKVLPAFEKLGISAVEQPLPYWDFEGHSEIRKKNTTKVKIMMDESIHTPYDASRAARLGSADTFNIKFMKCGGLYNGLKIADIAKASGINCMVGCMCETKLSLAAGLSLVAAHDAVTEGDLDSFLLYKGEDDGLQGGFIREGGNFRLLDKPGFGFPIDF